MHNEHKTTFDLKQWSIRMRQQWSIGRAIAADSGNWHYENGVPIINAQKMPRGDIKWSIVNHAFNRDYRRNNAAFKDDSDNEAYDVLEDYTVEELHAMRSLWLAECKQELTRQERAIILLNADQGDQIGENGDYLTRPGQ